MTARAIIEAVKDFAFFITHPSFWILNRPYNSQWDAFILECIGCGYVARRSEYTALMRRSVVWVENYPYGYGLPYQPDATFSEQMRPLRPSRRTVKRLMLEMRRIDNEAELARVLS